MEFDTAFALEHLDICFYVFASNCGQGYSREDGRICQFLYVVFFSLLSQYVLENISVLLLESNRDVHM